MEMKFPSELIELISIHLPFDNFIGFMMVNRDIYNILWNSQYFWKRRMLQDFRHRNHIAKLSWRDNYMFAYRRPSWYMLECDRVGLKVKHIPYNGGVTDTPDILVGPSWYMLKYDRVGLKVKHIPYNGGVTDTLDILVGPLRTETGNLYNNLSSMLLDTMRLNGIHQIDIVKMARTNDHARFRYYLDDGGGIWYSWYGRKTMVYGMSDVVSLDCNNNFAVAIDKDGDVYGYGNNHAMQFGDIGRYLYSFTKVNGPDFPVAKVELADEAIYYIGHDGRVFGMGNYLEAIYCKVEDISCGERTTMYLDRQKKVWWSRRGGAKFCKIFDDAKMIECCDGQSIIIDRWWRVWCFRGCGELSQIPYLRGVDVKIWNGKPLIKGWYNHPS